MDGVLILIYSNNFLFDGKISFYYDGVMFDVTDIYDIILKCVRIASLKLNIYFPQYAK